MGDRVSATIEIGGELPRALLHDFLSALECEGLSLDWGNGPDVDEDYFAALDAPEPLCLTAHEVNYGNFDDVEAFCREHGLHYAKTWDQGGEFGPGCAIYRGAEGTDDEHATTGTEGGVLLSAKEIRTLGSWEAVTARLDALAEPIPPLTLTGEAPAEED